MKILYELIPSRRLLDKVGEMMDLVDGWSIADSSFGFPAPSATAIGCALKVKYPDKLILPIFVLSYKSPVEAAALALAAETLGLDGLVLTLGDEPKYGEVEKCWSSSEDARDFLRKQVGVKNIKFGCMLSPAPVKDRYGKKVFTIEDMVKRVKSGWDFTIFMRLTDETYTVLEKLSGELSSINIPIYAYVMVETQKNRGTINRIGWKPTTTIENIGNTIERLEKIAEGVVIACAGDDEGGVEVLRRLKKHT
ncbi:MAG: hypothetical protein QXN18_00370 [Nitrososphaerota archaeon]